MNATEMNTTDVNVTEANDTREAEGSCYDLGYKGGECLYKSFLGLPCDTGTDFIMPERCRNNADAERGISDAVKSVSQQYNTGTTQSPPLATSSEATDETYDSETSTNFASENDSISPSESTVKLSGIVQGVKLFKSIKEEANENSREIGRLYNGDQVNIIAKDGSWYKIELKDNSGTGYITRTHVVID